VESAPTTPVGEMNSWLKPALLTGPVNIVVASMSESKNIWLGVAPPAPASIPQSGILTEIVVLPIIATPMIQVVKPETIIVQPQLMTAPILIPTATPIRSTLTLIIVTTPDI
jgi:hypothetical protein